MVDGRVDELRLESEFCPLKFEPRTLNTNRRQQNESGSLGLIGNTQKNPVGLIVNAPGIAGFTGAGCNAGNDCFEGGVAVAGILELHCFASRNVGMPAGHGGHFPAAGDQFTRNGCTDITGRSGQQDAMCS